jgi:type IV pilus assembly protein PilP
MRARSSSLTLAAILLCAASAAAQGPYAAAINKSRSVAAETSRRAAEATPDAGTAAARPAPPAAAAKPAVAVGKSAAVKPAAVVGKPAEVPATAAVAPAVVAAGSAPINPEIKGFVYDPEGRRDPFVSLLRRGADAAAQTTGPRRPGLPGLSVSEVTLKGTMASKGGYIGLLKGADSKTYIVRPGAQLLDGTVQAVSADAVVILQQINDPLSVQKEREVRKTLRQTEEEAK